MEPSDVSHQRGASVLSEPIERLYVVFARYGWLATFRAVRAVLTTPTTSGFTQSRFAS